MDVLKQQAAMLINRLEGFFRGLLGKKTLILPEGIRWFGLAGKRQIAFGPNQLGLPGVTGLRGMV